MEITPLASGSQGNSLLLRAGDQAVLVDIGLPPDEIEALLRDAAVDPRSITAVCVTHRHKDHARGVAPFCAKYKTPVYSTRRTLRSLSNKLNPHLHPIQVGRPFRVGDVSALAVEVSHDAPQTVAFRFDANGRSFGMATDLGCPSDELRQAFEGLHELLLEFNYDPHMLATGPYPRQLRDRIASDRGHLSNDQAAAFLASLDQSRLRTVWLAHLSERNNRPALARAAAERATSAEFTGELRILGPRGSRMVGS